MRTRRDGRRRYPELYGEAPAAEIIGKPAILAGSWELGVETPSGPRGRTFTSVIAGPETARSRDDFFTSSRIARADRLWQYRTDTRSPMRIITLNVNGIRSAERRGFLRWMAKQDADVVCLQETKAQRDDLGPSVVAPHGYHSFFHLSDKKGYSGVALYTRKAPRRVVYGLDWEDFDREGRYLRADFADYSVVSLYIPSGSSSEARQQAKFAFLERLLPVLAGLRQEGREYLLCGDWNIAHRPIDLKNWRANQKNSGFLPEERAWLDRVFDEIGWVDAFRVVNAEPEQYTWWSNRGEAWAKNVGWRIDYQMVTPALAGTIRSARIYKDRRFSDHAPLTMDYDL